MWILHPNPVKANQYKDLILESVVREVQKKGSTKIKSFFDESRLVNYLIGEPEQLKQIHQKLLEHLFGSWNKKNESEYARYVKAKESSSNPDSPKGRENQSILVELANYSALYDDLHDISKIFDYEKIIAGNPKVSYAIAKIMGAITCTYCNRQYVFSLECMEEKTTTHEFKTTHIMRPDFDHWFAKSLYPDLALSYYNLIPSCKICNSTLKHSKETSLEKHIHPYIDKKCGFRFRYFLTAIDEYGVKCKINADNEKDKKRIRNTLKLFRIEEIYNAHSLFELKDLLDLSEKYPEDYISILTDQVMKDLYVTEEDVCRMLFGIEFEEELHLNRPFSKFKSDIIGQIREERGTAATRQRRRKQ